MYHSPKQQNEEITKRNIEEVEAPLPLTSEGMFGSLDSHERRKSELLSIIRADHISPDGRIGAAVRLVNLSDRYYPDTDVGGVVARQYLATLFMVSGDFKHALSVTDKALARISRIESSHHVSAMEVPDLSRLAGETLLIRGRAYSELGLLQNAVLCWSNAVIKITAWVQRNLHAPKPPAIEEGDRLGDILEVQEIFSALGEELGSLRRRPELRENLRTFSQILSEGNHSVMETILPGFYGIEQALVLTPSQEIAPGVISYLDIQASVAGFRDEQHLQDRLLCRALDILSSSLGDVGDSAQRVRVHIIAKLAVARVSRGALSSATDLIVGTCNVLSGITSEDEVTSLISVCRAVISKLDHLDIQFILSNSSLLSSQGELAKWLPIASALLKRSLVLKQGDLVDTCCELFNAEVPRARQSGDLAAYQAEWLTGCICYARIIPKEARRGQLAGGLEHDMKSIVELASDNWRSLAQKAHTLCHAGGKLIRSDLRNGRNKQALLTAEKILVGLKDSGKRWSSEIGSRQKFSSLASKIPVLDEKRQVSFLEKMFHFQVAPFIAPFSLQRDGDYERIKNYLDDSICLFQELTGAGRVGRDRREYLAGVLVDVLWNTVSVPIRDEATLELIDLKARKKCVQNFIRFSKELSETNQVRLQYAYDTLVSVQSELAKRRALE